MEKYDADEAYDTLSLSDLQMEDDSATRSEEVNHSFYEDFFGFSGEEWSATTTNTNSPPGYVSDHDSVRKTMETKTKTKTNPVFRSNSGSFRYMRFKMGSRKGSWRSKSVSVMASKSKSRWQVFMFGFGSGKFPTKMDLIDIRSRQVRSQSMTKVSEHVDGVGRRPVESGGRRSGGKKKVWWRLVDVLGCGGGYEKASIY